MLHELLLALFGTPGGIIIESDERFIVNPRLDFLSPAEIEIINRIAALGYLFKRIQRFQNRHGGIGTKLAL